MPTSGWRATWTSLRAEPPSCSSQVNKTTQSVSTLTEGRNLKFIFNISALAGILLKSGNAYLFFFQNNFSDDLNNSDILFGSECKREI